MKRTLVFIAAAILFFAACKEKNTLPVMGDHSVCEVNIEELSGLCLNQDGSALLSCGDDGNVKTVSFTGEVTDLWSYDSDMEGVTLDPTTGDIYLAIEGKQEVHRLAAPGYDAESLAFAVREAVEDDYKNNGLEAVEYYKDGILFVGSQQDANLWQYTIDGKMQSKVSLSSFSSEIAGMCYEPESDLLWVTDSRNAKIFLCNPDGTLLASYDIPFIENAESICVDRKNGCVWVGSDEDSSKLYKISFTF